MRKVLAPEAQAIDYYYYLVNSVAMLRPTYDSLSPELRMKCTEIANARSLAQHKGKANKDHLLFTLCETVAKEIMAEEKAAEEKGTTYVFTVHAGSGPTTIVAKDNNGTVDQSTVRKGIKRPQVTPCREVVTKTPRKTGIHHAIIAKIASEKEKDPIYLEHERRSELEVSPFINKVRKIGREGFNLLDKTRQQLLVDQSSLKRIRAERLQLRLTLERVRSEREQYKLLFEAERAKSFEGGASSDDDSTD